MIIQRRNASRWRNRYVERLRMSALRMEYPSVWYPWAENAQRMFNLRSWIIWKLYQRLVLHSTQYTHGYFRKFFSECSPSMIKWVIWHSNTIEKRNGKEGIRFRCSNVTIPCLDIMKLSPTPVRAISVVPQLVSSTYTVNNRSLAPFELCWRPQ